MNPNATITDVQFQDFLRKVRDLVEGPYTEWQKEIEVTNKFPEKFYQSNIDNDIYRYSLPVEYGGWGLNEKEILQVQEEFSRGPSGMRMHMHYASDLNWRILDDFGQPEVKEKYMPLFQDKTIFTNFALTEKTGGTGADLHSTAVWDEEKGKWILNGEKWLISHTDCSQFSYVICVTDPDKEGDERLSAFFVDMSLPGFELVPMPHMMGCRGSGHTGLKFTNVEIDPKFMLGERGQGMEVAMHSLAVSRVHIATSNLGIAQRMFETVSYTHLDVYKRQILLHVAHDERIIEHGLVALQTRLGGVACIESLCSRLASDLACCDRKVHTTNGIAEIHAHHSCITRDDNAIANELRHHLQATFRNNVTRVFNELATTDDRSDLEMCIRDRPG